MFSCNQRMSQAECLERLEALVDKPDDFRKWLKSRNPADCVGNATMLSRCPLATYLNEHLVGYVVEVETRTIEVFTAPISFLAPLCKEYVFHIGTPDWAHHFVCKIDDATVGMRNQKISASEALTALKAVEKWFDQPLVEIATEARQ